VTDDDAQRWDRAARNGCILIVGVCLAFWTGSLLVLLRLIGLI